MSLLSKSIILCNITGIFNDESDYQPILSKSIIQTNSNPLIIWFFLSKINISFIKKNLEKKLAKNPPSSCITVKQLDLEVDSLISIIYIAMNLAIA